jgi:hypothetical protein
MKRNGPVLKNSTFDAGTGDLEGYLWNWQQGPKRVRGEQLASHYCFLFAVFLFQFA